MPDGNGPTKGEFDDALAEYEELRLEQMSIMAKQSQVLERWEKKGGDRDQLRYAFKLSQLEGEKRHAKAKSHAEVHGWMDLAITVEPSGQESFIVTFDQKAPAGARGAELGSRLSLVRARTDGFNSGKHRDGSLSHNPWPADTEEALEWAAGYGKGAEYRKPPKPRKDADAEAQEAAGADEDAEGPTEPEEAPKPATRKRAGRGRGKSATQEMAERAAAMDKPGWSADRDFHDETEPPSPVH